MERWDSSNPRFIRWLERRLGYPEGSLDKNTPVGPLPDTPLLRWLQSKP
jgi:hypothetical protein